MEEHCETITVGTDTFVLREMVEEDLERGLLQCFRRLKLFWPNLGEALLVWRSLRHDENKVIRVLADVAGKRVVGTVTWIIDQKFYGNVFRIEDLSVLDEFEGKGLGRWLLDQSIKRARQCKAYKITLQCKDALLPWYTRAGFRPDQHNLRLDIKEDR